MSSKSICRGFSLGDRKYEAVGFLESGEKLIEVREAIRRATDANKVPIGKEDLEYVLKHQAEIPYRLDRFFLLTNSPISEDNADEMVAYLFLENRKWCVQWDFLYSDCGYPEFHIWTLVLRRVL